MTPSFMQRLRDSIMPLHDEAEKLRPLRKIPEKRVTLKEYKEILERLYGFVSVTEDVIRTKINEQCVSLDYESRKRILHMEKDLLFLGILKSLLNKSLVAKTLAMSGHCLMRLVACTYLRGLDWADWSCRNLFVRNSASKIIEGTPILAPMVRKLHPCGRHSRILRKLMLKSMAEAIKSFFQRKKVLRHLTNGLLECKKGL